MMTDETQNEQSLADQEQPETTTAVIEPTTPVVATPPLSTGVDDDYAPESDSEQQPEPESVIKPKVPFQLKHRVLFPLTPTDRARHPFSIGASPYPQGSDKIDPKYWKPIDPNDREKAMEWWTAVDDAVKSALLVDSVFQAELDKDPTLWTQGFEHEGRMIKGRKRDFGVSRITGEAELTGKKFLAAARHANKKSAEFTFPLMHSGFHLSIQPARDVRWLSFDAERAERRISIGRDSTGMILSTRNAYEQQDICDFGIEHAVDGNIENFQQLNLLSIIKATDIPTLAWGTAVANFIDGHPYSFPCLHDPQKCMTTTEGRLDLKNLAWNNKDKLTPFQLDHIANSNKIYSLEQIKKYQDDGIFGVERRIPVGDNITLIMQIPSAAEYLNAAHVWLNMLVEVMDDGLKKATTPGNVPTDRSRYIHLMRGVNQTQLREFSPWIKKVSIKMDNDGTVITSATDEDVANFLEENSGDNDIITKVQDAVKSYINEVTVTIIGYPSHKCSVCGKGVDLTDDQFFNGTAEEIVAMDPIKTFFWLMDLKVELARQAVPSNMDL